MDTKDVIELILAIIGGSGGLLAIFNLVVKANLSRRQNDADWIRNQVFTPEKYEAFRRQIADEVRKEMESDFQARIDVAVATAVKDKDVEIKALKEEVASLRHRMGNVEQAEQFKKDGLIT